MARVLAFFEPDHDVAGTTGRALREIPPGRAEPSFPRPRGFGPDRRDAGQPDPRYRPGPGRRGGAEITTAGSAVSASNNSALTTEVLGPIRHTAARSEAPAGWTMGGCKLPLPVAEGVAGNSGCTIPGRKPDSGYSSQGCRWMTVYGYARVSVREPEDKNLDLQVERLVRAGCPICVPVTQMRRRPYAYQKRK